MEKKNQRNKKMKRGLIARGFAEDEKILYTMATVYR